jgi:opacity protein-like surface antigen
MKFKTIAAGGALAALLPAAFAQAYVGFGVGVARLHDSCDYAADCRFTRPAGQVLVGYTLFEPRRGIEPFGFQGGEYAIEASFTDQGAFRESYSPLSLDVKGSAWGIGGAWHRSLGRDWAMVLRLGAAYGTTRTTASGAIPGSPALPLPTIVGGSETNHAWNPYFGIGASHAIAPNVRLEADWNVSTVNAKFGTVSSQDKVNTFALGLNFGF